VSKLLEALLATLELDTKRCDAAGSISTRSAQPRVFVGAGAQLGTKLGHARFARLRLRTSWLAEPLGRDECCTDRFENCGQLLGDSSEAVCSILSSLGLPLLLDGKGTQTGALNTGSLRTLLGGCPPSAPVGYLVLQRYAHGLGSFVFDCALCDTFAQGDESGFECRKLGLGGGGTSLTLLGLFARSAETFAGGFVLPCEPIGLAGGLCELAFEAQLPVARLRHCAAGIGLGLLDRGARLGGVDQACRGGLACSRIVADLLVDTGEISLALQR